MTKARIAISLPQDRFQEQADNESRESLQALLRDLIAQYGKPSAEDFKCAERALGTE